MINIEKQIEAALVAAFSPLFFNIEDESKFHHRGEQTHYKVVIVSDTFIDLPIIKRHQQVYAALGDLMQQFHALAIHTYTADEWRLKGLEAVPDSPVCRG